MVWVETETKFTLRRFILKSILGACPKKRKKMLSVLHILCLDLAPISTYSRSADERSCTYPLSHAVINIFIMLFLF